MPNAVAPAGLEFSRSPIEAARDVNVPPSLNPSTNHRETCTMVNAMQYSMGDSTGFHYLWTKLKVNHVVPSGAETYWL